MTQTRNPFAQRRDEIGKTQRQIAESLGKTPQAVSAWECGKAIPEPSDYDRVAEAYELDREWVVTAVMALDTQRQPSAA